MEVPRYWRTNDHRLNPGVHGFRPARPVDTEPSGSAKITCPEFDGNKESLSLREVKKYSQIMNPGEVHTIPQPVELPVRNIAENSEVERI